MERHLRIRTLLLKRTQLAQKILAQNCNRHVLLKSWPGTKRTVKKSINILACFHSSITLSYIIKATRSKLPVGHRINVKSFWCTLLSSLGLFRFKLCFNKGAGKKDSSKDSAKQRLIKSVATLEWINLRKTNMPAGTPDSILSLRVHV